MSRLGFEGKVVYRYFIATLRVILEQSLDWNSPIYTTFINFEKAFDSIDREEL